MIDLPCKKYITTWSQNFPNHLLYSILFWCSFKCDVIEAVLVVKNNLSNSLFWEVNSTFKQILQKNWPPILLIMIFLFISTLWGGGRGVVWARTCLKSLAPLRLTLSSHAENNKGIKRNCYFSQTPTRGHRFL